MRLKFWRHDPEGLRRAKQADADAGRRLDEARKRAPLVRLAAAWARQRREENSLSELFSQSLGGGRP